MYQPPQHYFHGYSQRQPYFSRSAYLSPQKIVSVPIISYETHLYQNTGSSYSTQEKEENKERVTTTFIFSPELFLKPSRPFSQFINDFSNLRPAVLETFRLTTGNDFPEDITIRVCDKEEMLKNYDKWHPGILGFAQNRLGFGISEIFLLENDFDLLFITAGHEIGHVLSFPASSKLAEEAKAFAFEAAWIRSIFSHDIASLRSSINLSPFSPAQNGIHDRAFDFVRKQLFFGIDPLDLFRKLSGNLEAL